MIYPDKFPTVQQWRKIYFPFTYIAVLKFKAHMWIVISVSLIIHPSMLVWEWRGEPVDTVNPMAARRAGIVDRQRDRRRGGEAMCLCFRPSLLRLISTPAATRRSSCASPTELASTPRLDQSTMWLRPGAKRTWDRRTGEERQTEGRDTQRESSSITHVTLFYF